jgi:hypothetical protein
MLSTSAQPTEWKRKSLVRRKYLIIISVTSSLLVVGIYGSFLLFHVSGLIVPRSISNKLGFPLYYPKTIPPGYQYASKAYSVTNQVLILNLKKSSEDTIYIAEQSVPSNLPNFTSFSGFQALTTNAGKAAIGTNNGQAVAIIESNTTLITISGSKIVPSDVITELAKSMSSR